MYQDFKNDLSIRTKNPETKKMMSNNPILDEPIEEINVPVMKPLPYVARVASLRSLVRNYVESLVRKSAANARKTINKFADWILSLPNEQIKRGINEREAPLRGFLKTYRIDGVKGQDQDTFISHIKPRVINFLSGKRKPFQVKFIFTCKFRKGVSDEEIVYSYGYFHTNIERIMEDADLGKIYDIMTAMCLERSQSFRIRVLDGSLRVLSSLTLMLIHSSRLGDLLIFLYHQN